MENFKEKAAMCALNRIFGYYPTTAHAILESLGSAGALFTLEEEELLELLGPYSKFRPQICPEMLLKCERELERFRDEGVDFITINEESFPSMLKECDDSPVGLYIRAGSDAGDIFGVRPQISIVGTRDISPYGEEWCRRIVIEMSRCRYPPLIVSGLALGTDITAHLTALESGLPTVAVLPGGIDSIYPPSHRRWALKIARTPGCALITDYPPGTQPAAINFLRRNRIIAGLGSATVLVESKLKGGGLITADFAFNYDRDVYALPGRIDDIRSQGCNRLIRSKIAEPITDIGRFLEALGLGQWTRKTRALVEDEVRERFSAELGTEKTEMLALTAGTIRKKRGMTPEQISEASGLDFSDTMMAIGILEAEGFITTDLLQRCSIRVK